MAPTEFAWSIQDLERFTIDGFVYKVYYRVNAFDGVYTAGAYGSLDLKRSEQELIPFSKLTEDVCVQWVKDLLGTDKVGEIEQAMQLQLDEQHMPARAKGLPW